MASGVVLEILMVMLYRVGHTLIVLESFERAKQGKGAPKKSCARRGLIRCAGASEEILGYSAQKTDWAESTQPNFFLVSVNHVRRQFYPSCDQEAGLAVSAILPTGVGMFSTCGVSGKPVVGPSASMRMGETGTIL